MRGNNLFAYDLVVKPRGVNSRVALSLRSIEPKRAFSPVSPPSHNLDAFRDEEGVRGVIWSNGGEKRRKMIPVLA